MIDIPDKPFAATREEWRTWHKDAKKKYPVRYFLRYKLRLGLQRAWNRFVHSPWYWLKCRVWHRYNVVVCRKLGPTWVDRDHLILHVAFQCLADYVEKEAPTVATQTHEEVYRNYRDCGPEYAKKRADDWMGVKELYHWYVKHDPYDNEDEKQDEMLHRLIDVRRYLWT